MQFGQADERRVLHQGAEVVYSGFGAVHGLGHDNVSLRQIEFHRRLRRNFGEGAVVRQDAGRLDLPQGDVPHPAGTAHLAERRVVERERCVRGVLGRLVA